MWDQLVAAIKARNSAEAIRLIGQMSSGDFVKDYTKLHYSQSPIHNAAYQDLADVVEQLLNKKPDLIGMVDNSGRTALHYAAENVSEQVVNKLLQLKPDLIGMVDSHGNTALHEAARGGSEQVVNKLLELKPDLIGMVDNKGYTALHEAARGGSEQVVNKLLQLKSDLAGMVDSYGQTALHRAAQYGREQVVNKLLQLKPNLAGMVDNSGRTALHIAAREGREQVVNELLEFKPDLVCMVDNYDSTALHFAAERSSEQVVNKLLQLKSNLAGMVDSYGQTALHRAAQYGREQVVNKLLQLKPNLAGMVDKNGYTALHIAAQYGREQVVNKLLQLKPDLAGMVDNSGRTALHEAAQYGREQVVNKLLQLKPALAGMVDNSGRTALHIAAREGREQVVNELLEFKPDLAGMVDSYGQTALHIAAQEGKYQIVSIYSSQTLVTILRLKDKNNDDQQIRQFLDKAIATYDNNIKVNAGNASAYFKKANVLYALNRPEEAIKNYEKALELNEAKYIEQIVINMSANLVNALVEKDLTLENICKVLPDSVSVELNFLLRLDINNGIKEIFSKKIAAKFWIKNRNDIEQVQQEIASNMTDQSNMEKVQPYVRKVKQVIMNNIANTKAKIVEKFWIKNRNDVEQVQQEISTSTTDQCNIEKVQQVITNNIANLNRNIALIEDTYNVDLSFLKESFDHLVYFDANPDRIIHDNGIITLSNLALLSLAKSGRIGDEKIVNNQDLVIKTLNLHKLFQSLGVSKLFNLSDDIISKLKAATTVDQNQAQYVQKLAESHDSSHIALNIHDTDLTGDSIPLPI